MALKISLIGVLPASLPRCTRKGRGASSDRKISTSRIAWQRMTSSRTKWRRLSFFNGGRSFAATSRSEERRVGKAERTEEGGGQGLRQEGLDEQSDKGRG